MTLAWNGDDALKAFSGLLVQPGQHRMCCLADSNYENSSIRTEVVKIFANAQNVFVAPQVPLKCATDARFTHSMLQDVARDLFHLHPETAIF